MPPLQFDGQLARFDITIPADRYTTWEDLADKLSKWCTKFVFQKEKGSETGYIHWQVRILLGKKKTLPAMLSEVVPAIGGNFSVTSNTVHTHAKAFNYVMKEDSRLEGPWTDEETPRPRVLTTQLVNFMKCEKYGWQAHAEELCQLYHERWLYYLYDPHYNSGKSIFCEYLEYNGLAEEIPGIFTLAEDIMQFVMSMPKSKCYLFDMPAAMKKEKMNQMYTALEMLKNGFLFDKRYNGKKQRIDRPGVICFANNLPKLDLMAPDRWKVLYITPDKNIVPFDPGLHPYQEPGQDFSEQFS